MTPRKTLSRRSLAVPALTSALLIAMLAGCSKEGAPAGGPPGGMPPPPAVGVITVAPEVVALQSEVLRTGFHKSSH